MFVCIGEFNNNYEMITAYLVSVNIIVNKVPENYSMYFIF